MVTRPGYAWDSATSQFIQIGPVANTGSSIFYQASEPTTASTGDIWIDADDDVPGITSALNYRWRKVAAGGETSLSGSDSNGLVLAYNPGYEQLFINGVLQYRGSDYTATNGTSITGLTALVSGDVVEVISMVTYAVGDTYTQAVADSKFQTKIATGMSLVVPTSIIKGASGTASVAANGLITFTGTEYVTINNCFTSAYTDYKVVAKVTGVSASTVTYFRLASGGSANANAEYTWSGAFSTVSSASASRAGGNALTNWQGAVPYTSLSIGLSTMDLMNPQVSGYSFMNFQYMNYRTATDYLETAAGGGYLNNTSSYDGIHYNANGNTFTGTIRIYGYNNGV